MGTETERDQSLLDAETTDGILAALAKAIWAKNGGEGECPKSLIPSQADVWSVWLDGSHPTPISPEAHDQSTQALREVWPGAKWGVYGLRPPGEETFQIGMVASRSNDGKGPMEVADLARLHKLWRNLDSKRKKEEKARPRHPLGPIVRDWQAAQPTEFDEDKSRRGILPGTLATRFLSNSTTLPTLAAPDKPGIVFADLLPDLTPDKHGTPALIMALFERAGGKTVRDGRASVEAVLLVESLLSMNWDARTHPGLRQLNVELRTIVRDWLQWNPKHYRKNRNRTGGALRLGFARARGLWVPIGTRGGGFFPFLMGGATGWALKDSAQIIINLPAESGPGAGVDRQMLRSLRRYGLAWLAYLSLCFEWDYFGSRGGKLILPTRPKHRRDQAGLLLDAKGDVITGKGGAAVKNPYQTKQAVPTGEREPNPARTRYGTYDAEGLLRLCYPAGVIRSLTPDTKRVYVGRAIAAILRIEKAGGCVIERLGRNGGLPWRIMPPTPPI